MTPALAVSQVFRLSFSPRFFFGPDCVTGFALAVSTRQCHGILVCQGLAASWDLGLAQRMLAVSVSGARASISLFVGRGMQD